MDKIEKAKKLISGIVEHQKQTDDRLRNFEDQVKDLKQAQQLLSEAQTKEYVPEITHNESKLKSFVDSDGSVQWNTTKQRIFVEGKGTVTVEKKGLIDSDTFSNEWHAELNELVEKRSLARLCMKEPHTPRADIKLHQHLEKAPSFLKPAIQKAFSDNAGVGAEWIPDQFSTQLYQTFQIPRGLRALLPTINMDRETLLIPKLARGGRPYIKGAVTDDLASYQASTIATEQKTIRAKALASLMNIDDSAGEDSAFAIIPALTKQIAQDLEDAFEDCMINGDTAATHQDDIGSWNIRDRWGSSGLGGAADHRRLFLGLRAASMDKGTGVDCANTQLDFAKFMECVATMGELAAANKVCVVSPEVLVSNFLQLNEVITLDKFGSQATVLTGQLGSLAGIPIVMSRYMSADLNGSGLYDNATKTQTGFVIFNTDSWSQFVRRQITVESDKKIESGALQIVATMRACMDSADASSVKNVVYAYDLPQ